VGDLLSTIRLPELLGPVALAHLQGAGVVWKTTFGSDHAWERCIMACEPCFTLHPSMFQGAARHALMHCYSPLGRCTIGIGEEPLLRSAEEAQRLARLLHRMEKARDAHMSKGGRVADILVGRLQLHNARLLMVIKVKNLLVQGMCSSCHKSSMSVLEDVLN